MLKRECVFRLRWSYYLDGIPGALRSLDAPKLTELIPAFPVPLRRDEPEPIVDLQGLLHQVYDRAAYDLEIDYTQEPVPPLEGEDARWIDELLKQQNLR